MAQKRKKVTSRMPGWEIMQILHDHGLDLLPATPEEHDEVHRRIMFMASGAPIFVAPTAPEGVPPKLEVKLRKLGIYLGLVSETELMQRVMAEPDVEYMLNHERGRRANANGVAGERRFKLWCVEQKHTYLKTKFLAVYLGKIAEYGDEKFWMEFGECAKRASRRALEAVEAYLRKHGCNRYGESAGLPDFLLIEAGRRKKEYFVEVKSGAGRLSAAQMDAIEFLRRRAFATRVWNADAGLYYGGPS